MFVNFVLSVQKPREQVADAEALLDITSTLMTSVKAQCNEGMTPSEYVACIVRDFGIEGGASIDWKKIGLDVPYAFKRAPGCCTMYVYMCFFILLYLFVLTAITELFGASFFKAWANEC